MKVYVVITEADFMFDQPDSIWSTLELAEQRVKQLEQEDIEGGIEDFVGKVEIVEYVMDEA
jgi:hypothetical protein